MNPIRMILPALLLLVVGTSMGQSGHPTKGWMKQKPLTSVEDFSALKPGDQVILACKKCDAVSVTRIESGEHAMMLCAENASLECPACKKVAKTKLVGPPSKQNRVVEYVDQHGESCMTLTKLDRGEEASKPGE